MSRSHPRRRRAAVHLVLLLLVVCTVIAAALVVGVAWLKGRPTAGEPRCVVTTADGQKRTFTPEQTANAALVSAEAMGRGTDHRASVIALATAMQESGLDNITHGDRDSVGLFQQRPSQGWGTVEQIMDPHYSTVAFYNHLEHVDHHSMSVTEAAQAVQQSGVPDGYAKHEGNATAFSDAFMGTRGEALNCVLGPVSGPSASTATGGTDGRGERTPSSPEAGARDVADGLNRDYNHDLGRVRARGTSVTVRPRDRERGWAAAQWAVANAQKLGVTRVSYQGRTWDRQAQTATRFAPVPGWQDAGEVFGGSPTPEADRVVISTDTAASS